MKAQSFLRLSAPKPSPFTDTLPLVLISACSVSFAAEFAGDGLFLLETPRCFYGWIPSPGRVGGNASLVFTDAVVIENTCGGTTIGVC